MKTVFEKKSIKKSLDYPFSPFNGDEILKKANIFLEYKLFTKIKPSSFSKCMS